MLDMLFEGVEKMTSWTEHLPDENGYYWIWTGKHLEIGCLEVHPEGPVKTLTSCSGVKAPVFNNRLFNGWQIGDRIEKPMEPEAC